MVTVIPYAFSSVLKQMEAVMAMEAAGIWHMCSWAATSRVYQVHRVKSTKPGRHSSFINMTQLGSQHLANLLVNADCIFVPNNVTEYSKLADNIHKLCSFLPWSDHVVGGDRWLDPVHQDVGIPLLRILNILQERLDVCSVHIVSTAFSLWL